MLSLFERHEARGERGGKLKKARKMWGIILIFFFLVSFFVLFLKEAFAVKSQGELDQFLLKDPVTIWLNWWIRERLAGINDIYDLFSVVTKNTARADDPVSGPKISLFLLITTPCFTADTSIKWTEISIWLFLCSIGLRPWERVDFEKGYKFKHLKLEISNNSRLGHEPELRIARLTTWKFIKEKQCRDHVICNLKVSMSLKRCLQSNRCGAPRLDHRHPKPYIKLNLKIWQ